MEPNDKHVLILGLGETGLSMARYLAQQGARLSAADTREHPPGLEALVQAHPGIEAACGPLQERIFEGVDLVAVSPGVALSGPLCDPVVAQAQERGIPFAGDVELFAQALVAEQAATGYAPKVLAITGTNGKTTVTALATRMAQRAGKTARAAGNISPAVLDAWMEAKAANALPQVWVLELSSYQLEAQTSLAPHAAVMLNLSEDHLDRHGSMEAYAAAKARIFANQAIQVLNRDDAASMAMRRPFDAKKKKDVPPVVLTFGLSAPHAPTEYGLVREARDGGLTWLAEGTHAGSTGEEATPPNRLMPLEVLKLKGSHNATNALAALALNRAIGLPLAPMLKALRDYAGEAHRVQPVAIVHWVQYVDDSKGTNVGATLAALTGLAAELRADSRIVLIAGGDGKGQDFNPLAAAVRATCRAVVLIGRDAPAMRAALEPAGVPLQDADSLEGAVAAAASLAPPGDTVLMSPACASFDMFRNYGHRAEVFVAAVRELARTHALQPVITEALAAAETINRSGAPHA